MEAEPCHGPVTPCPPPFVLQHLPIENEDGLQLGIEAANVVIQSIK